MINVSATYKRSYDGLTSSYTARWFFRSLPYIETTGRDASPCTVTKDQPMIPRCRSLPTYLFFLSCCTIAPSLVAQPAPAARPQRIAVFNSRAVFDSMPERAAAESNFALEQAKARTMLAEATDSLRKAVEEFSRAEERLTPRQREATTLHLRARELMVEEMVANLDDVIARRNEELQAPLRARLVAAVQTLRKREGYDLVIDISQLAFVVDADPRIDVTSVLLKALRATEPARSKRLPSPR